MRNVHIIADLAFPREMVWSALTDSDQLAEWLMPNDFRPELGWRFTFRTKPAPGFDGIVHAEVLELSPPERLVLSWRGGPLDTRVTFELEETADGTRLTLIHAGFAGLSNLMPRIILGSGWPGKVRREIAAVIARRCGDPGQRP